MQWARGQDRSRLSQLPSDKTAGGAANTRELVLHTTSFKNCLALRLTSDAIENSSIILSELSCTGGLGSPKSPRIGHDLWP